MQNRKTVRNQRKFEPTRLDHGCECRNEEKDNKEQQQKMEFRLKRNLCLVTAIFEGAIFSGVLIGWSSLVYSLKKEGRALRCINISFFDGILILLMYGHHT